MDLDLEQLEIRKQNQSMYQLEPLICNQTGYCGIHMTTKQQKKLMSSPWVVSLSPAKPWSKSKEMESSSFTEGVL